MRGTIVGVLNIPRTALNETAARGTQRSPKTSVSRMFKTRAGLSNTATGQPLDTGASQQKQWL